MPDLAEFEDEEDAEDDTVTKQPRRSPSPNPASNTVFAMPPPDPSGNGGAAIPMPGPSAANEKTALNTEEIPNYVDERPSDNPPPFTERGNP